MQTNKITGWLMMLVLAIGTLTACQSGETVESTEMATPIPILRGTEGSETSLRYMGAWLIQSRADLNTIGSPTLSALDVDFDNESLMLLAMGEQPSAGYRIQITGISKVGDELFVSGIANVPDASMMNAQMLTCPYAAAVIPKTRAKRVIPEVQ